MTYDFTTLPDRWDTGAEKYELMKERCPDVPRGIVPFSVADMDLLPPPELAEGICDFMTGRVFGYTRTPEAYITTFQRWMRRRHGVDIPAQWVIDADSVLGAMHQMIRAFTRPGDGIVDMTPAYPPFLDAPELLNRRRLDCPMVLGDNRRYTIDFTLLEELCSREDTAMLIFCNPHNPVGRVWERRELEQVADICLRHGVFIISDEIHADLILPGHTFTSMASLEEKYLRNCAVSTSATKTFNIAAIKGAAVVMADEERRSRYHACRGDSGRDILSYAACIAAWERCEGWLDQLLTLLDGNFRLLADFCRTHLPEVGVTPLEATYLPWLDFRFLGMTPEEQERFMGEQARCFFTEGYHFGAAGRGFERWSIACPAHVLQEGLERMESAVRGR
mgnify:FL=1